MRKDLEQKLYSDFPRLYSQRSLTIQESCMAWNFECNDGWFQIIYDLSKKISEIDPTVQASQVKEKFGSLRFYVDNCGNDEVFDLIDDAEDLSYITCEICGSTDDVSQTKGWISTLCRNCRKQ